MAKEVTHEKKRMPVLILHEKQQPRAFLFSPGDAVKVAKDALEVSDKFVEAFTGETSFLVHVRDSLAREGKHVVDLTFENFIQSAIYVESISVRIPKPNKKDPNKGAVNVSFAAKPKSGTFSDKNDPPTPLSLPLRVDPKSHQDVRMTFDLLDQQHFKEHPYLLAEVEFSPLNEKEKKNGTVVFRIRWT